VATSPLSEGNGTIIIPFLIIESRQSLLGLSSEAIPKASAMTDNNTRHDRGQRNSWCFTINNPSSEWALPGVFITHVQTHPQFRYMIFQEERGTNGTPHYQGYIEFNRSLKFNVVKKLFKDKAHLEFRRGTRNQAREYCKKEESRTDGPFEVGDWRRGGQGTRTDLLALADEIQKGANESDIASEYPVMYIKFHNGINKLIMWSTEVRSEPPKVILCYGPTGTGKTRYCYATYPELYRKPCDTRWFDGYIGQKVLLLDDFGGRTSKMSLLYLLQLLDRYPMLVEAKGKYLHLQSTTIIITTNYHPRLWYDYSNREQSYAALKRRIHEVYWFKSFDHMHLSLSLDSFFDDWFETCDEGRVLIEVTESCSSSSDGEQEGGYMSGLSDLELMEIDSSDSDSWLSESSER